MATVGNSKLAVMPVGVGIDFPTITERFLESRRKGKTGARWKNRERSVEEYRYDLERFFQYMTKFGFSYYHQLAEPHIAAYVDYIQDRDIAESSQNKVFRSLKAFLRWVERDSECRFLANSDGGTGLYGWNKFINAFPVIKGNKSREYIPTPEVMNEFLEAFDRNTFDGMRDYAATSLMLDTGVRIGEICHMKLSDIKFEQGLVHVPAEGKTGERYINFSIDKLGPTLRRYLQMRQPVVDRPTPTGRPRRGAEYMFVTEHGKFCTPFTFDSSFLRHRKRTGLGTTPEGNLTPHVVRHFFSTHYLLNGGTIPGLQQITGHKSVQTLMKYLHMAERLGFVKKEHQIASPLRNMKGGWMGKKKRELY